MLNPIQKYILKTTNTIVFPYIKSFIIYFASQRGSSDGVANLLALSTPRMFIWDFVVGIFARKPMLHMGWVLSIICFQYLYSK